MKLLLPDTAPESPTVPDVEVVTYAVHDPIPTEHLDAEVLVVWGNTGAQLADCADRLEHLRWVAVLAAGPDVALRAGFAPDVIVTNGRGLHDAPVVEHTLMLVLAAVRRFDLMLEAQHARRWDQTRLGGILEKGAFPGLRTLHGRHVTIWGFGSIGQALAPHLTALGADVTGIATHAGERAGFPVVTAAELDSLLPRTDVLIGLLPSTADTRHRIDAHVLDQLPEHAWFVNVGRGATLDETALVAALTEGRLGGASLDVTEIEPLPRDSPLWTTPRLFITPHAAGGRPHGVAAFLERNLTRYLGGEPLENQVRR